MRVIMFDRQSLFIHGAMYSLQKLIPKIEMTGARQTDELWAIIRVTLRYRHDRWVFNS